MKRFGLLLGLVAAAALCLSPVLPADAASKYAASSSSETYGIQWLLVSDLTGLPNEDLTGASTVSIEGFSMPFTKSGAWTTLGPDGSTGIVLDPSDANGQFWMAPTVSGLASHYGITTNDHDQWVVLLSFTSLTAATPNTVVRVRADNAAADHGYMIDHIRNGALKFRVNNYVNITEETQVTVKSLGLLVHGRGLSADARWASTETLDFSAMTANGYAANDVIDPLERSVTVDDNEEPITAFQIGADLNSASDGVTLTGIAIGWIPAVGDAEAS